MESSAGNEPTRSPMLMADLRRSRTAAMRTRTCRRLNTAQWPGLSRAIWEPSQLAQEPTFIAVCFGHATPAVPCWDGRPGRRDARTARAACEAITAVQKATTTAGPT